EEQRPASDAFGQLSFDSPRDRLNFKMMCAYCHQIGTVGFRTPERPVDWETMIRRMDGFGGLYPHTKETITQRIIDTYKDDAVKSWPAYVPPPAPSGMVTKAKITAWEMGEPFKGSFHDLEVGDDGLAYVVHIGKQYTATLDPETGERIYYRLPRGSHGPHSIEVARDLLLAEGSWKPGFGVIHGGERGLERGERTDPAGGAIPEMGRWKEVIFR
ncbi:hypothetical protein N9B65_08350, partial [Akkermansiaceae bacterium]|nr:hypothetical protein [Akkermansiaceae bacterium]